MNQEPKSWRQQLMDDPMGFIMENAIRIFMILLGLTIAVAMIKPVWHMLLAALNN